jgi:transposase-like protein
MKRHDLSEISVKLRHAEEMIKGGMSQKDACKSLGISVMTFHRWRKLGSSAEFQAQNFRETPRAQEEGMAHASQVEALKLENDRLRRIVSDLLLEKMKVQEALDRTKK